MLDFLLFSMASPPAAADLWEALVGLVMMAPQEPGLQDATRFTSLAWASLAHFEAEKMGQEGPALLPGRELEKIMRAAYARHSEGDPDGFMWPESMDWSDRSLYSASLAEHIGLLQAQQDMVRLRQLRRMLEAE